MDYVRRSRPDDVPSLERPGLDGVLLLELLQADPSLLKGLAMSCLVLLVAKPDAKEVAAVIGEESASYRGERGVERRDQVERVRQRRRRRRGQSSHILLRVLTGSARVESGDIVEELEVSGLKVDIEGGALGGKVEGVEGEVLLFPDGRNTVGESTLGLEEVKEGSTAVLGDNPVVDEVDDGGAFGVAATGAQDQ